MSAETIISQTATLWAEPPAQCQATGQRPRPTIVGCTVKDPRATLAVMLCQDLGAPAPAITAATGVGEDTQQLIAARRTEDSKRLAGVLARIKRSSNHAR